MTTPIAAAFHRLGHNVQIITDHPIAYELNPHASLGCGSITLDLDLAYELRPDLHAVDAFFLAAGIDGDKTIQYIPRHPQPKREPYIVIHAAKSWPSRTFPAEFWIEVAARLPLPVIWIGTRNDFSAGGETRMDTGLPTAASVIEDAAVAICSDSAMLHLAGATLTPIVGLFTCVRAARRMPYRQGSINWRAIGLEADIDCIGCIEQATIPTTDLTCRRFDNMCVRSLDPAEVVRAALALI